MKVIIEPKGQPVIVTTINGLTHIERLRIEYPTLFECDSILSIEPLPHSRKTFGVNDSSILTNEWDRPDGEQLDFVFPTE